MEIVGRTDRGQLRQRNEDSLGIDERLGVAVVADGMGGLAHGDLASSVAVTAVIEHLQAAGHAPDIAALSAALSVANRRVHESAQAAATLMGTTAVLLALDHDRCLIAHVGDSRAYRFHRGELSLLTRDHSMVQDMVERGLLSAAAARQSPSRNVITRAVGLDAAFEPDVQEVQIAPDDLVLLCSDGLWDMLDDERIAAVLAGCGAGRAGLERVVDTLVDEANETGGLDNITVVLARAG